MNASRGGTKGNRETVADSKETYGAVIVRGQTTRRLANQPVTSPRSYPGAVLPVFYCPSIPCSGSHRPRRLPGPVLSPGPIGQPRKFYKSLIQVDSEGAHGPPGAIFGVYPNQIYWYFLPCRYLYIYSSAGAPRQTCVWSALRNARSSAARRAGVPRSNH